MGAEFKAQCHCGYETPLLTIDDTQTVAICYCCQNVINPSRFRFRFDFSNCEFCNALITEENLLGKGWYITGGASLIQCPKCQSATLSFYESAHLHIGVGVLFPKLGDLVHVEMKRDKRIRIPDLHLEKADIKHNAPSFLKVRDRFVAAVTKISMIKPTDNVTSLFYRKVVSDLHLDYHHQL